MERKASCGQGWGLGHDKRYVKHSKTAIQKRLRLKPQGKSDWGNGIDPVTKSAQ